jgi:hypothetical protein
MADADRPTSDQTAKKDAMTELQASTFAPSALGTDLDAPLLTVGVPARSKNFWTITHRLCLRTFAVCNSPMQRATGRQIWNLI